MHNKCQYPDLHREILYIKLLPIPIMEQSSHFSFRTHITQISPIPSLFPSHKIIRHQPWDDPTTLLTPLPHCNKLKSCVKELYWNKGRKIQPITKLVGKSFYLAINFNIKNVLFRLWWTANNQQLVCLLKFHASGLARFCMGDDQLVGHCMVPAWCFWSCKVLLHGDVGEAFNPHNRGPQVKQVTLQNK